MQTLTINKTLIILVSIILSACGYSKKSIQNESNQQSLSPNQAMGKCSVDMSNNPNLGVKLQAFESAQTGLRSDLIRVQVIRFPNQFSQSSNNAKY